MFNAVFTFVNGFFWTPFNFGPNCTRNLLNTFFESSHKITGAIYTQNAIYIAESAVENRIFVYFATQCEIHGCLFQINS